MYLSYEPGWMKHPGQKRCYLCGRVGTRDFVNQPGDPVWMGPWECKWDGPCWKRRERRRIAEEAKRRAEEAEQPTLPEPVDLDALMADPD